MNQWWHKMREISLYIARQTKYKLATSCKHSYIEVANRGKMIVKHSVLLNSLLLPFIRQMDLFLRLVLQWVVLCLIPQTPPQGQNFPISPPMRHFWCSIAFDLWPHNDKITLWKTLTLHFFPSNCPSTIFPRFIQRENSDLPKSIYQVTIWSIRLGNLLNLNLSASVSFSTTLQQSL